MYIICYIGPCDHESHQIITINRIHFTLARALFFSFLRTIWFQNGRQLCFWTLVIFVKNKSIYIYIYIYAIGNHIPHFSHKQIAFPCCCYVWPVRKVKNLSLSLTLSCRSSFTFCFLPLVKQIICHNMRAYRWQIPSLLGRSVYASWVNLLTKLVKLNHHNGSFQGCSA